MHLKSCGFSLTAIAAASFALTACSDSNTDTPFANNPIMGSNESSSSSDLVPTSSGEPLSSSEISALSSSSIQAAAQSRFQTWHGAEKILHIKTGYDAGTETSGYWYEVNDNSEGGLSKVLWNDATTEQCVGLCSTFILEKGSMTYNPFAAVAFDMAGKNAQGELVAVDATDMGGICIAYTSEFAPTLELVLDSKQDTIFASALPNVSLQKTSTPVVLNFKWSDFKMPSWAAKYNNISGEEAAKKLVSIQFKVQATTGSESKFDIIEVGSYGNCTYTPPPTPSIELNPDSDPNPNLPKTSPFETWYGSSEEYQIVTGYDNGLETSGYWFDYDDNSIGGMSKIAWPVELGNEYDIYWADIVILHCQGVCGTAIFDKGDMTEGSPFVGLGFQIAGEKSDKDPTATPVDASAMGGVCVTYKSYYGMDLKLGLGEKEKEYEYNIPTKTLPKSQTFITKYVPWADFKQPIEGNGKKISGEEAAKILATIKFEIYGEHGKNAEFSIKSVGPYNGGDCHP